jgi:hypothetical protein
VILSAFDALVAVASHYRTIALYSADRAASVSAVDASEDREMIAPLLFAMRGHLAPAVALKGHAVLRGPTALGPAKDRFFYLPAEPAGSHEVIVVPSGAGMYLHGALPPGNADAHGFVLDPQRMVWKDCERSVHCHHAMARRLAATGTPS